MLKPLSNTKIIDFSRLLPGPLGTKMLADLGAEVIKIQKTDNADYVAFQPPFIDDVSTLYHAFNHNKEIKILNWDFENEREALLNLIKTADVLIEQFRPGVMKHWGLDFESLKAINPKLIYISLSGYGQSGPNAKKAGHDLNYLAISGLLDQIRDDDGKPVIPGIQIADIVGGAYSIQIAVLSAILERQTKGAGLYVDVSMTDAIIPLLSFPLSQFWGGFDPKEMKILSGALVNYNVYKCSDSKWIALAALELKFWDAFCDRALKLEWKRNQQYELSVHVFPKHEMEDFFKQKSRDEWVDWAAEYDFCLSPVLELSELEKSAHYQEKKSIIEGEIKGLKHLKSLL
jgi:crotonobetainyl-CoA:carnitine CoA-transferase CaiB-like acyl-CoA transferase